MENQTNYSVPTHADNSSGANTVLLVLIIVLLAGFGFWWYRHSHRAYTAPNNPSIDVNVQLPSSGNSGTSGSDTSQQ